MSDPKEKFPKNIAEWIESTYPEFDSKLGISKVHLAGHPPPEDDSDLHAWKEAKVAELKDKFTADLKQVDDWEERFNRKYYNRKRKLRDLFLKSSPHRFKPPVIELPELSTTTARRLFEKSNTASFSQGAAQRRAELGQSSKSHAGHWQVIASAAWKALSDKEKSYWEEQAREHQHAQNGQGNIFENQEKLAFRLYSILRSTMQAGQHHIGSAAYHVLYGFRDVNDLLKVGMLQVTDNESSGSVAFSDFFPDYEKSVLQSWSEYCEAAVRANITFDYATLFSKNEADVYTLPKYDEENGKISDLRLTLKAFLELSWECAWPRTNEMPALPWSELVECPWEYFHSLLIFGPQVTFLRPENMSRADILAISEAIVNFQTGTETRLLSIFRSQNELSCALNRRSMEQAVYQYMAQDPEEVFYPRRSRSVSQSFPPMETENLSMAPMFPTSPHGSPSDFGQNLQLAHFETPSFSVNHPPTANIPAQPWNQTLSGAANASVAIPTCGTAARGSPIPVPQELTESVTVALPSSKPRTKISVVGDKHLSHERPKRIMKLSIRAKEISEQELQVRKKGGSRKRAANPKGRNVRKN